MNPLLATDVSQTTPRRIGFVDVARGIAIWCIVLGHQGIPVVEQVVFAFHVPIFFLFAGFFLDMRSPFPLFLRRKVHSLLRPYVFASIALLIFGIAFHLLRFGIHGLPSEIANRLAAAVLGMGFRAPFPFGISVSEIGRFMPYVGATWFLLALFWSLALMRGVCQIREYWQPFVIIALFIMGKETPRLFWLPWSLQPALCATLFVYLGVLAKRHLDTNQVNRPLREMLFLMCTWAWCGFVGHYSGFHLVSCRFGRGISDIMCSLAACWCVIEVSRFINANLPRASALLRFFGRNSLVVLCIHAVELHSWGPIWGKISYELATIGIPCEPAKWLVLAIKFSLIAIVTFLFARLRSFHDSKKQSSCPTALQ